MTNSPTPAPIRMRLAGFKDFPETVSLLRATGARRESDRVFVIDHSLTAQQAASLLEFLSHGHAEGFLRVEVNAPEPADAADEELESWWFGR
ncbi:hypothetical protein OG590_39755 (plasmid) [Streptomyces goshikiensis]|uniref:hypothetical protein n=1 Tax=Streptomyces goshikiensis TaxID=1942 RepID=UPI003865EF39|nr:hypothetical protein OG590_39755 [Streptomyces goshikiensis]